MISLNFTTIAARINPTPRENATNNANGINARRDVQCNSTLIASITKISAVKEAIKLIKLDITLDNTNKYLGTYTFLIKDPFIIIAPIELFVASEKKLKITCPLNK